MQAYNRNEFNSEDYTDSNDIQPVELKKLIARQSSKTKFKLRKKEFYRCIANFKVYEFPPKEIARKQAASFHEAINHKEKYLTDRALISFVRHNYTNYQELIDNIPRNTSRASIYEDFKLYTCYIIIKRYGLEFDPRIAAFGYSGYPKRFDLVADETIDDLVIRIINI